LQNAANWLIWIYHIATHLRKFPFLPNVRVWCICTSHTSTRAHTPTWKVLMWSMPCAVSICLFSCLQTTIYYYFAVSESARTPIAYYCLRVEYK
jgi:hypothetical protein